MKAVITMIDWQKNEMPAFKFFQGENADEQARAFGAKLKHEWPGCCCRIEWDEDLRLAKTRKEPAHIRVANNFMTLTYFLPNNRQTRAAILKDDRAKIMALADPTPPKGSYLTLQYVANASKQALIAFENNDWFWILERAHPVFDET